MSSKIKRPYVGFYLALLKRFPLLIAIGFCISTLALLVPGPIQKNSYMGASYCGSCHAKEYTSWLNSPHAQAFSHLPKESIHDQACLNCHATAVFDSNTDILPGVQCEACHGPGQYYAKLHIKKDVVLSKLLFMQKPNEDSCRRCHAKTEKLWSFKQGMEKIDHWSMQNKMKRMLDKR